MDLKRLKTFLLVSMRGNLQKAATELQLTVPTISAQVKTLERELNVSLFHHTPNKLILTEQGHTFAKKIEGVITSLERAIASVSNKNAEFVGNVSVSISNEVVKLFASSTAAFIKQHPQLAFTVLARRPLESLSLVVNGEIDLAVGRFRSLPRGIRREKLIENGFAAVFRSNHRLARKESFSLEDLSGFPIITLTRSSQTRKTIDAVFRHNQIKPNKLLEVGTCQSAVEFAKHGVGVALVHDICVLGEVKGGLRSINMTRVFGRTPISIIHKNTTILTPSHQALIEIFRSNANAVAQLL